MDNSSKLGFEKLNNSNYFIWKYRMEMFLIKEGVWETVAGEKPDQVTDTWNRKEQQAKAWLGLLVDDGQLTHIRKYTTAKEMWNNLKLYHEKSTLSNKVQLMRRICNLKLADGGNAESHIVEMTTLFEKLDALGEDKISDGWMVAMLLSSLPRSYDILITALETRPEGDLTINLVQSKLIEEYRRQINTSSSNNNKNVALNTTRTIKNVQCFFCNKKGHLKKDCRHYIEWKSKAENNNINSPKFHQHKAKQVATESEYCFHLRSTKKENIWIIDSGATTHMVNNKNSFIEFDNSNSQIVTMANGQTEQAEGQGTCLIAMVNNENLKVKARLKNVLYVPKLDCGLISVKRLVENGYIINFSRHNCEIIKESVIVGVADQVSNLYVLRQNVEEKTCIIKTHNDNCHHKWHRVFGHRDVAAIRQLVKENCVRGIKLTDCGLKEVCEVCVQGKMTRKPFPKLSHSKTSAPLDLIHTDVCGPMVTITPGGKKYILTFIDDYSRYTIVYLLQNKSEVTEKFKEYVQLVKTKFMKTPKIIRSDRGGEYINLNMQSFCKEQGIEMQYTAGYSPQQNGVAERKNRYIMEAARCMLLDAKMDNTFWGEAVMTANYLQNRLPSKSVPTTPFELWERKKPNINHLRIFGSKVYLYRHKEQRSKLDKKATQMTFVGYDNNAKAYRVVDTITKRIYISRDVTFIEGSSEKLDSTKEEQPRSNIIEFNDDILKTTKEIDENPSDFNNSILTGNFESTLDDTTEETEPSVSHLRKSSRDNFGVPPVRLIEQINTVKENISEPKDFNEAMKSKEKLDWISAMNNEITSLKENNTWSLVEMPKNRNIVGCKWVFKLKNMGSEKTYKARLVAQGYSQKFGMDYDEVFAPVVRQASMRILLTIAGKRGMKITHLDIKSAFLNGSLQEEIYMKQPPGFITPESGNKVCKLNKSLYGLKQAAKSWNDLIHSVLSSDGFNQSRADPCLYYKNLNNVSCYILVYVDDLLVASKDTSIIKEVEMLMLKNFKISNLGDVKCYIGLNVDKDEHGNFRISQKSYIEKVVKDAGLEDSKISDIPMDPGYQNNNNAVELLKDNKEFQRLMGCLLYISVCTRPDISTSVSILSSKVSHPSKEDWNELKRLIKYLKGTKDLKLVLSNHTKNDPGIVGYADANWAEGRDRKSNTGYIFQLYGGSIDLCCRKQTCVALSSTEAEFIALSEACKEVVWLRYLLKDFNEEQQQPTIIWEDNQSCLNLIKEEKLSHRSKHIDTKVYFVKDYVDKKIVQCRYCPSVNMLADLFTKPLSRKRTEMLRTRCGLLCE